MAFIGTPLDTRNTFQSLVGKRFNGDGSTTEFTLDVAPSSTLDIEVFVGNVRQDPNSAYTLSGTTLTFTGAPPSGTNNIYVVHQAKAVGTIEVPATNSGNTTFNGAITMNGGVVLNEESADVDFRVESNGNSNMLLVDAGNDRVGIGTSSPSAEFHVDAAAGGETEARVSAGTVYTKVIADDANGHSVINFSHDLEIKDGGASDAIRFKIDGNGHVTMPSQSAFTAKLGSTASNVTGDSTAYTVINYQTETIDRNADFNPSNGTFTAPITGLYLLTFRFHLQNIASNHNDNQVKIQTSNQSHSILGEAGSSSIGFSGSMNVTGSLIVDMDANDTVTMLVDFRGGSKVVDVHEDSFFMGYLLG